VPPGSTWLPGRIREIKDRLSTMVLDGDLTPGDRAAAERIARMMKGA
jgi:hypothetical protein